ncbi:MAG: hypothetical protein Q9160_005280 [Pyrenula sp. 1 TL-2023]
MKASFASLLLVTAVVVANPVPTLPERDPASVVARAPAASESDCDPGEWHTQVSYNYGQIITGTSKPGDIIKKALEACPGPHGCAETTTSVPIKYAAGTFNGIPAEVEATISGTFAWDCKAQKDPKYAQAERDGFVEALSKIADGSMTHNVTKSCTPTGCPGCTPYCEKKTNNYGVNGITLTQVNTEGAIDGTIQISMENKFSSQNAACDTIFGLISTAASALGPVGGVASAAFGSFSADICGE